MFDIFGTKDPQKALQRAREYMKDGKIDAAVRVLEGNLTDHADSFDLYMELARLYFDMEQRTRVVELLRHTKTILPDRVDEIIALTAGLFSRHASIDLGDFLIQLYMEKEEYHQIIKILKELSEREVTLLLTRYEKLKQGIESKNVISKKDIQDVLVHAAIRFFLNESEVALAAVEFIVSIETFGQQLLDWAQNVVRERFNDPYAGLLLLKVQIANRKFNEALVQIPRMSEKFPDFSDALIEVIESGKYPAEMEMSFTQILTDLYIRKGDFDTSIDRLQRIMTKDPARVEDVIKGLRELERIDPKNIKVLYSLADTYLEADKISLAIGSLDKIIEVDPQQFKNVLERYKKAFAQEKNNPLVIQGLVNTLIKEGDLKAAVDVIEEAYKNDSGLVDEYIINLNLILEKDLKNSKALYLLGICYAQKGDHDNAVVIFDNLLANNETAYVDRATREIIEKKPDNVQYLGLRARSLALLHREDEALSLLTQYLKQEPSAIMNFLAIFDLIINQKPNLAKEILPLYAKHKKTEPFVMELAMSRAYAFAGDYDNSVSSFERCFAEEGHRDMAKRALIETIKERPKAVPLLLTAARIFLKEGEVEVATQFFKTAQMVDPKAFFEIIDEFYDVLKDFPKDREVRTLLVDAFFNRRLWARVIEEARRAIDVFGRDAQYFNLRMGEALVENGALSEAVRPLMLSLDGPQNYSPEVVEYLDKILEIDKSNVPAHVARGRALSRAHRVEEAVGEFLLTARIVPSRAEYILKELKTLAAKAMANPYVLFAMGNVEILLKDHETASQHLLQACELDPAFVKNTIPLLNKLLEDAPSPMLEYALARIYHFANLKSSAIKHYIRAQAQDKAFREPAIAELKKLCQENTEDIESRKGLAQIFFDHSNLEDALDLVKGVYELNAHEISWVRNFVDGILQKNPQHIPSYYFLCDISISEKNQKLAIETYKKLAELSPAEVPRIIEVVEAVKDKDDELLLYLGDLYKEIGDVRKAIEIFDALYESNPSLGDAIVYQIKEILGRDVNFGAAYLLASKIFVAEKEFVRAIEALEKAKELIPANEDIILKEGQLYYKMGQPEKAIKIYSELLEKSKDRKAVFRLIRKTRDEYYKEQIGMIKGDGEEDRLKRANIYLIMNKVAETEKELDFTPSNNLINKHHALLKARLYLKANRPMDALEIMRDLPVDKESAPVYADIYESMGAFKAAAVVLRNSGIGGMDSRIKNYEKLAQERRSVKGRYLIEGRS